MLWNIHILENKTQFCLLKINIYAWIDKSFFFYKIFEASPFRKIYNLKFVSSNIKAFQSVPFVVLTTTWRAFVIRSKTFIQVVQYSMFQAPRKKEAHVVMSKTRAGQELVYSKLYFKKQNSALINEAKDAGFSLTCNYSVKTLFRASKRNPDAHFYKKLLFCSRKI